MMSKQESGDRSSTSPAKNTSTNAQAQKPRQLKIKTFGEAMLSVSNVPLANANQAIEMVKRAEGRRYKIETDGRGMINIAYDASDAFTIGLFNNSRWVTTVYIGPNKLDVGNVSKAHLGQVTTVRTTQSETRNVHTTFKIENRSDTMLKRLDMQGHETQWFSVFSHNANLLMVRPNGDWVAEKLLYMTDQVATQAINNYRRSNGQNVLPSTGTIVARRRQPLTNATQSSATQTEEANARAIKLLDDEQRYETRLDELENNWQLLREKTAQYKEELAEWKKAEEEWQRLKEGTANRKNDIDREIKEIDEAEKKLEERKEKLQEDTERHELEEAAKKTEEEGRSELAQQDCEWYIGWARKNYSDIKLNERFSQKFRSVFQNYKIEITREPKSNANQDGMPKLVKYQGKAAPKATV